MEPNSPEVDQSVRRRPRTKRHGRSYYEGKLHTLLCEKIPQFAHYGRIDVGKLCKATGDPRFTCCLWMLKDKLSPDAVTRLVRVSDGIPKEADLLPFLLA